jgi:hypothetical protein
MRKFEYCYKEVIVGIVPDWDIHKMGLNGWELCAIIEIPKGYSYIFKREIV